MVHVKTIKGNNPEQLDSTVNGYIKDLTKTIGTNNVKSIKTQLSTAFAVDTNSLWITYSITWDDGR